MPEVPLEYKLDVNIQHDPESDGYVIWVPAFELADQGETPEEAVHNAEEAIALFMESCIERGVLDQVLTGLGWRKEDGASPRWVPPELLQKSVSVSIPVLG